MRNRGCLSFLILYAAVAAAQETWTPELSMQVRSVANVQTSSDGKLITWTETRAIMDADKSEFVPQIFLSRGPSTPPLQLTRGEKGATSPALSPDAGFVYFLSERSGKRNLYRIPASGGEAEMLTNWKGSLGSYKLAPNGKWIALAAAEEDAEEEKAKKEKRDFKVVDEKPRLQSLWIIPAEEDSSGKRTPRKLTPPAYHVGQFDWSPDSRHIAYETTPTPGFDDARLANISEVEVEGGTIRTIATTGAAESQPNYSPDGRFLAYVRGSDPPNRILPQNIALYTRGSGAVRNLAATPDGGPRILGWSRDSRQLLVSESRGVRGAVYGVGVDGPVTDVLKPDSGTISVSSVNDNGTYLGLTRESPTEPVEAYVMEVATGKLTRVSKANAALPKPPLGETKVVKWKGRDGKEVEGVLTLPVGYQAGKKYPAILVIHGGPAGVFTDNFIGSPNLYPVASFAAKGYAVLRPNPRGSVGYGPGFRAANTKDWGGGDYQDLMAGVDQLVAQGIADPDRLGVMGWSYGGYMTSWVISQTTRFKAAAIGAGITNVWSMWGTNDIPSVLDDYFGGAPWESPELYMTRSGLYHVKNVTTPTLFLHGEQDMRVPISQAFEYYHALKRRGVTTKMVTYPRTPHGPQEPKFTLDIMQRHLDWVEKYVR